MNWLLGDYYGIHDNKRRSREMGNYSKAHSGFYVQEEE